MFKFFESIASIIETAISFAVGFFSALIDVFTLAIQSVAYIVLLIGALPVFLKVFAGAFISLAIVRFVLNKGE